MCFDFKLYEISFNFLIIEKLAFVSKVQTLNQRGQTEKPLIIQQAVVNNR